jgi:predicted ATPase
MTGEYEPEGDRMFNGNTLNCRGWLTYRKAGRAGLVFVEAGGTGGADDSWRDLDREAELAYQQSMEAKQAG